MRLDDNLNVSVVKKLERDITKEATHDSPHARARCKVLRPVLSVSVFPGVRMSPLHHVIPRRRNRPALYLFTKPAGVNAKLHFYLVALPQFPGSPPGFATPIQLFFFLLRKRLAALACPRPQSPRLSVVERFTVFGYLAAFVPRDVLEFVLEGVGTDSVDLQMPGVLFLTLLFLPWAIVGLFALGPFTAIAVTTIAGIFTG